MIQNFLNFFELALERMVVFGLIKGHFLEFDSKGKKPGFIRT